MDRIESIRTHQEFVRCLNELKELEQERRFCRHGMEHLLDVARIAMILSAKRGGRHKKDVIYAMALLHDLGKGQQYLHGIPHEQAGAVIAEGILTDCGYQETERQEILRAVLNHRNQAVSGGEDLSGLLYDADKASRCCYLCPAERECSWEDSKKNMRITY